MTRSLLVPAFFIFLQLPGATRAGASKATLSEYRKCFQTGDELNELFKKSLDLSEEQKLLIRGILSKSGSIFCPVLPDSTEESKLIAFHLSRMEGEDTFKRMVRLSREFQKCANGLLAVPAKELRFNESSYLDALSEKDLEPGYRDFEIASFKSLFALLSSFRDFDRNFPLTLAAALEKELSSKGLIPRGGSLSKILSPGKIKEAIRRALRKTAGKVKEYREVREVLYDSTYRWNFISELSKGLLEASGKRQDAGKNKELSLAIKMGVVRALQKEMKGVFSELRKRVFDPYFRKYSAQTPEAVGRELKKNVKELFDVNIAEDGNNVYNCPFNIALAQVLRERFDSGKPFQNASDLLETSISKIFTLNNFNKHIVAQKIEIANLEKRWKKEEESLCKINLEAFYPPEPVFGKAEAAVFRTGKNGKEEADVSGEISPLDVFIFTGEKLDRDGRPYAGEGEMFLKMKLAGVSPPRYYMTNSFWVTCNPDLDEGSIFEDVQADLLNFKNNNPDIIRGSKFYKKHKRDPENIGEYLTLLREESVRKAFENYYRSLLEASSDIDREFLLPRIGKIAEQSIRSMRRALRFVNSSADRFIRATDKILHKTEKALEKPYTVTISELLRGEIDDNFNMFLKERQTLREQLRPRYSSVDKSALVAKWLDLRLKFEAVRAKLKNIREFSEKMDAERNTISISSGGKEVDLGVKVPERISVPSGEATKILNLLSGAGGEYIAPFFTVKRGGTTFLQPSKANIEHAKQIGVASAVALTGSEEATGKAACVELARVQYRNLLLLELKYARNPDPENVEPGIKCRGFEKNLQEILRQEKEAIIEGQFRSNLAKKIEKEGRIMNRSALLKKNLYGRIAGLLKGRAGDKKISDVIRDLKNLHFEPVEQFGGRQRPFTQYFSDFIRINEPLTARLSKWSSGSINSFLNRTFDKARVAYTMDKLTRSLKKHDISVTDYLLSSIEENLNRETGGGRKFQKGERFYASIRETFNKKGKNFNPAFNANIARIAFLARENHRDLSYAKLMERATNRVRTIGGEGFIDSVRDFFYYLPVKADNFLQNRNDMDPARRRTIPEEETPLPFYPMPDTPETMQKILLTKMALNPGMYQSNRQVFEFLLNASQTGEGDSSPPMFLGYHDTCRNFNEKLVKFKREVAERYDPMADMIIDRVVKYTTGDFEYRLRKLSELYRKGFSIPLKSERAKRIIEEILKDPRILASSGPLQLQRLAGLLNHGKKLTPKVLREAARSKTEIRSMMEDLFEKYALNDGDVRKDYALYKTFQGYLKKSGQRVEIPESLKEEAFQEKKILDMINRFLDLPDSALKRIEGGRSQGSIRQALFEQLGLKNALTGFDGSVLVRSYIDLRPGVVHSYWYRQGRYKLTNFRSLRRKGESAAPVEYRMNNPYWKELNRLLVLENLGALAYPENRVIKAAKLPKKLRDLLFNVDKRLDASGIAAALEKEYPLLVGGDEGSEPGWAVRYLHSFMKRETAGQNTMEKGVRNQHFIDFWEKKIHLTGSGGGKGFFDNPENFQHFQKHLPESGIYVPFEQDAITFNMLHALQRDLRCERFSPISKPGHQINISKVMGTKKDLLAFINNEKENIQKILPAFGVEFSGKGRDAHDLFVDLINSKNPRKKILDSGLATGSEWADSKRREEVFNELIRLYYESEVAKEKERISTGGKKCRSFFCAGKDSSGEISGIPDFQTFKKLVSPARKITPRDMKLLTKPGGGNGKRGYHFNVSRLNEIRSGLERDLAATFIFEKALPEARKKAQKSLENACECKKKDRKNLLAQAYFQNHMLQLAGDDPHLAGVIAGMTEIEWKWVGPVESTLYLGGLAFLAPPLLPHMGTYWLAMAGVIGLRQIYDRAIVKPAMKSRADLAWDLGQSQFAPESGFLVSKDYDKFMQEYQHRSKEIRTRTLWWDPIIILPAGFRVGKGVWREASILKNKMVPGIQLSERSRVGKKLSSGLVETTLSSEEQKIALLVAEKVEKMSKAKATGAMAERRASETAERVKKALLKEGNGGKAKTARGKVPPARVRSGKEVVKNKGADRSSLLPTKDVVVNPQLEEDILYNAVCRALGRKVTLEEFKYYRTAERSSEKLLNQIRASKNVKKIPLKKERIEELLDLIDKDANLLELKALIRGGGLQSGRQAVKLIKDLKRRVIIEKALISDDVIRDLTALFRSRTVSRLIKNWRSTPGKVAALRKELIGSVNKGARAGRISPDEGKYLVRVFSGKVGKRQVSPEFLDFIKKYKIFPVDVIKDPARLEFEIARNMDKIILHYGDKLRGLPGVISHEDAKLLQLLKELRVSDTNFEVLTFLRGSPDEGYRLHEGARRFLKDAIKNRFHGLIKNDNELRILLSDVPDPRRQFRYLFVKRSATMERLFDRMAPEFRYPDGVKNFDMYVSGLPKSEKSRMKLAKKLWNRYMKNPGEFFTSQKVETLRYADPEDLRLLGLSKAGGEKHLMKAEGKLILLKEAGKISEAVYVEKIGAINRCRFALSDIKGRFDITPREMDFIFANIEQVGAFRLADKGGTLYRPVRMTEKLKNYLKETGKVDREKEKYLRGVIGELIKKQSLFDSLKQQALWSLTERFSRTSVGRKVLRKGVPVEDAVIPQKGEGFWQRIRKNFDDILKFRAGKVEKTKELPKLQKLEKNVVLGRHGSEFAGPYPFVPEVVNQVYEMLPPAYRDRTHDISYAYFRDLLGLRKGEFLNEKKLEGHVSSLMKEIKNPYMKEDLVARMTEAMFGDEIVTGAGLKAIRRVMVEERIGRQLEELKLIKRLMVRDKGASRAARKELPEHLRAFFLRKADHSRFYRVLRDEMRLREVVGEDVDALSPERNIVVKYIRETLKYDGPLDVTARKYIKKAGNELQKQYHTDLHGNDPKVLEMIKKVNTDLDNVKKAAGFK